MDLRGAVALVTGGNGGLGRRTAMHHFGQKGPESIMPPAGMSSTSARRVAEISGSAIRQLVSLSLMGGDGGTCLMAECAALFRPTLSTVRF